MTVAEFIKRADEVAQTRDLKEWQVADLQAYKRIVMNAQKVTSLDEYYLTIVGVPWRGLVMKKWPTKVQVKKAEQASLF